MADGGTILVTGAAGQLGAVGRTVTGPLLDRGLAVRAMVRREDDRAAALRAAGGSVLPAVGRRGGGDRPAVSIQKFVSLHADQFGGRRITEPS